MTCTFKEKLGRALRNTTEVGSLLEVFYYELLGANSQIDPHILVTIFFIFPLSFFFFNTTFRNVVANSFQVRRVLWSPGNSPSSDSQTFPAPVNDRHASFSLRWKTEGT